MRLRLSLTLSLIFGLLAAAGCEPECREVEPTATVQAELIERVGRRLDDADASDAQRARILALFAKLSPAIDRLRAQAFPAQRAIVAELRRPAPDRQRLAALIDANVDATLMYAHAVVDVALQAHPVLEPAQRKQLAERASQPSSAFEGSFWLDRAVDYLMLKLEATGEQRRWFTRIEQHILARGRALQLEFDAIRADAAAELAKDVPDRARLHAILERGRAPARAAMLDLAGFYLLFASKLTPHQRPLLAAELVRFEPCSVPAQPAPAPGT